MRRAILIALSFGLIASNVSAQPTDQPGEVGMFESNGESPYVRALSQRVERRIDPRQTQKLIERWKNSNESAEREKLETELRALLRREFAARLAVHEREIKQLEEKVRQLRERVALRKEKQEEIVAHRLQQILRDAQGLGWGAEGVHGEAMYWPATDATSAAAADPFAPSADSVLNEAESADALSGESAATDLDPVLNRN